MNVVVAAAAVVVVVIVVVVIAIVVFAIVVVASVVDVYRSQLYSNPCHLQLFVQLCVVLVFLDNDYCKFEIFFSMGVIKILICDLVQPILFMYFAFIQN